MASSSAAAATLERPPSSTSPAPSTAADNMEEMLDVVDEDDVVLGQAPRGVIHRDGLLHRAVHVFVFNTEGHMLLQRRSEAKKLGPGCWDLSCAEHVSSGETYPRAALRGLNEELAIDRASLAGEIVEVRAPKLQRLDYPTENVKDYEFVALFAASFSGEPVPDLVEVSEARFWSIGEIQDAMVHDANRFTRWFRKDLEAVDLAELARVGSKPVTSPLILSM